MAKCEHRHPTYGNQCYREDNGHTLHMAGDDEHGNGVTWNSANGADLERALRSIPTFTQSDIDAAVAAARKAAFEEAAQMLDGRMKRHTYECDCPAGPV